jgi:hypothetical protein
VLRQIQQRSGIAPRLAACIHDPRAPERIAYGLDEIIRFRTLVIAAGYEDGDDADTLRSDRLFKLAMNRLPDHRDLCLQSMVSRAENLPDRHALLRMGRAPLSRCKRIAVAAGGRPLSDERAEYLVKDRLSFMRFLGLGLADAVPDANTIWTYREALILRRARFASTPTVRPRTRRCWSRVAWSRAFTARSRRGADAGAPCQFPQIGRALTGRTRLCSPEGPDGPGGPNHRHRQGRGEDRPRQSGLQHPPVRLALHPNCARVAAAQVPNGHTQRHKPQGRAGR